MGQVACLFSVQCSAKETEPTAVPAPVAPIRKERLSDQFSKEFPSAPEGTNAKLPLSTL